MTTFRSTANPPGQLWHATRLDDDRVRMEPVMHMGCPTTDDSDRAIVVSRRVAEDYFQRSLADVVT
jgi:hypothetical protein